MLSEKLQQQSRDGQTVGFKLRQCPSLNAGKRTKSNDDGSRATSEERPHVLNVERQSFRLAPLHMRESTHVSTHRYPRPHAGMWNSDEAIWRRPPF